MRGRLNVDVVSLASGALVAALGALILLDVTGALEVSIGWIAVALTAAVGAILLISGLDGGEERHDSGRGAPRPDRPRFIAIRAAGSSPESWQALRREPGSTQ